MAGINKLFVSLLLGGNSFEVGELVLSDQKIYFRYNADYLKTGLNLSPIKLPFSGDIVSADKQSFDGLFGVFNDSLPDGWGMLLLDRSLSAKGIDIARRKELMKLATHFGLKNAGSIIEEVQEAISHWRAFASECGISRNTRSTVQTAMDKIRD
jgi:serine/threonine-protein kinase HipA